MVAYHSKMAASWILLFSFMFFGLGIWSLWFDFNAFLTVLLVVFCFLIGGILVYTFIYNMCVPNISFEMDHQKIIIYSNHTIQTHDLVDIKKVAFNFNVPYLAIAFVCELHKKDGHTVVIASFIRHQVRVYKAMKKLLAKHNIETTRTFRHY